MAARELVKQLFEAAIEGNTQQLQAIAPRVSPEGLSRVKDGNGRNALHFAAQGGQVEMAEHLLESEGISVNSQDDQGWDFGSLRTFKVGLAGVCSCTRRPVSSCHGTGSGIIPQGLFCLWSS